MIVELIGSFFFGAILSWNIAKMRQKRVEESLAQKILLLEKDLSRLQAEKEMITGAKEQLKKDFELLSHQIFEKKNADAEKNLNALLNPLKEKLGEFQQQVEKAYHQESRERFALKKELELMALSNQKMSEEANNLTRAFKGDVKAQGCWGEIVLEKILDSSGLRRGEEYHLQGKDLKLISEEGRRLQPDVIISLPEDKHLIIDSKVSLIPYERYLSAQEESKEPYVKELLKSINSHIDDLHKKNYLHIDGINPPDFVLLFVPIEGLFSFALEKSPDLFTYGWERGIMLVSPSTLLATLRTIHSIWKYERQSKNTMEIVRQSGLLYDKFALLFTELEKMGELLSKAEAHYEDLMRKIKTGKGSLLSRVESLKTLGAKATKSLPTQDLIEVD